MTPRRAALVAAVVLGVALVLVIVAPHAVGRPARTARRQRPRSTRPAGSPTRELSRAESFAAAHPAGLPRRAGARASSSRASSASPGSARGSCGPPAGRSAAAGPARCCSGVFALAVIGRLVTLPLSAYGEVVRHRYGLSTRSWGLWIRDVAVSTGIDAGLTALGLLALVFLARKAPRTWWAWGAVGAAGLVVAGSFLWPVVIEPAFNTLRVDAGRAAAHRPARAGRRERHPGRGRAGVRRLPADHGAQRLRLRVRVDPADRRLRHGPRPAHRRRGRVDRRPRARPRRQRRRPHRHPHRRPRRRGRGRRCSGGCSPRGCSAGPEPSRSATRGWCPCCCSSSPWAAWSSAPVQNLVSRHVEARADVHALDLTDDPDTFIEMQRGLATTNLADPDPPGAWQWFFGSHPTLAAAGGPRRGLGGAAGPVTRTLVVTNDFPPRQGGIQTFVAALLERRPPDSLVVLASRSPGWEDHDAALPYPVVRRPTAMLLPTPATARAAADLARRHGCDSAFFGAAAPLGLIAPALRAAGVGHLVGATHGHETGWVALPGSRQLMQRIAGRLDVLTYISEYTRERLAPALGARTRLAQLSPGVDVDRFTPGLDGTPVRRRHGLGDAPVVVCVSRLVARKGQDVLVAALAARAGPPSRRPAAARRRRPGRAEAAARDRRPRTAGLRRPHRCGAARPSCRRTTPPATSSRCRAGPAGRVWTSRGSGWSSSRRPPAACRWWPAPPAARRRRCRRASPGTSSSRGRPTPSRRRSPTCSTTRRAGRRWARPGRAWVEQRWSWTTIAATFADLLEKHGPAARGAAGPHCQRA